MSWCAGLSSGTCDLVNETQLGQETTFVSRLLSEPIMNGERYYVSVKVTNGAGVTTSVTSDGVTVDDTPPVAGIVIEGAVIDINYVNGENDISASWSNFEDVESGIDSYGVAFCDAWNLSSCPQTFTEVGNATNVTIAGKIQLRLIKSKFVRVTGYPPLFLITYITYTTLSRGTLNNEAKPEWAIDPWPLRAKLLSVRF